MSPLHRIFEAGACAAACAAFCQQCVLAQAWPGAGQEPRKLSLCLSGWHSSFESTLKPLCSQHFWRCHLVDTELTSWPPPILKCFRWEALLLLFSNIQLLNASVPGKFWPGGWYFLHGPSCHNIGCGAAGVCPVGSWFSVLPHCLTLDRFTLRCEWPWLLIPFQQLKYLSHTIYCHEGRCCPSTQAKGIDICMNNFWFAGKHFY